MGFKPALNITEQIADHLAEKIVLGALSGGDRIQELKIARELDVSRGSVREALLILERRHLIEIVPRRGAIVNTLDGDDAIALLDLLASTERHWLEVLLSKDMSVIDGAQFAVRKMDIAARDEDLHGMLQAREEFYASLVTSAYRHTRAVFECLLPSSQVILRELIDRNSLELRDLSRYYGALVEALASRDAQRTDELLGAFHKRIYHLCARSFSGVSNDVVANPTQPSFGTTVPEVYVN